MPKTLPIFSLNLITQKGWDISNYTAFENADLIFKAVHRDDHYIFIFQQKGRSRIMLDFDTVEIDGCAVLNIMPGQAHQGILADNVDAWFFAVDPNMVRDSFRHFFEEQVRVNQLVYLESDKSQILTQIMQLLNKMYVEPDAGVSMEEINRSLVDACIGIIVNEFKKLVVPESTKLSRTISITKLFKSLLLQSYRIMKTPASYAGVLNITPSYLNEAVKKTTGFPASYWINQEIVLEAKRILFHTDSSVKEIAIQLGYEDYSYFTRVFTKIAGVSPVVFRQNSRELS